MLEHKIVYHQPRLACNQAQIEALRDAAAAPYDNALARLRRLQASTECGEDYVEQPAPTYRTGFGEVTFEEIHNRTRSLAAHIMRQGYGIENHDDLEDSLQFGYWKLWEKLERDPTFLEEKGHAYAARSVCFRAKRERYRHIRHNQRNEILPEEIHPKGFTPHSWESREVDRKIDLENALVATALFFSDEPTTLLALYYVTCELTIKDMQALGMSRHTLRDHAKKARDVLQSHLR